MEEPKKIYENGGLLKDWGPMAEKADPTYGKRLYLLLNENKIIPDDKNGFKFLSVSSNNSFRESSFAQELEKHIDTPLKVKPLIIASDIAPVERVAKPKLEKVDFSYLQGDARHIPTKEPVDIIFDRMGAIWHTCHEALENATRVDGKIPEWETEEIVANLDELFLEYKKGIKPNGYIIFDDPENNDPEFYSTGKYVKEIVGNIKEYFLKHGLKYTNLGSGFDRIAILQPVNK